MIYYVITAALPPDWSYLPILVYNRYIDNGVLYAGRYEEQISVQQTVAIMRDLKWT